MFEKDMVRLHNDVLTELSKLIMDCAPVLDDPRDQADMEIAVNASSGGDAKAANAMREVVIRRFTIKSAAFCRMMCLAVGIAGFVLGLLMARR